MKINFKVGRPTVYTLELAKEICNEIVGSNESIIKLCKKNTHWPQPKTIFQWMHSPEKEDFLFMYLKAKTAQTHKLFDKALHIANKCTEENVRSSALKIKTLENHASKLCSKIYGNTIKHEIEQKESIPEIEKRIKEVMGAYGKEF